MAISSLTRFTVPLASDQSASSQGMLMPKLKFRFRVLFQNFGVSSPTTELTKQVVDFKRPNVTFEEVTLDVYNSKVYLAGKHSWEAVTCNLRDDAAGNVSKLVGEQLQKQFDFAEQASASNGVDYKFSTNLEILDGGNGNSTPVVLETWELYGCFLTGADYGDVAYNSNDPVQIALNIRYDNAMQTTPTGGAGTLATPQARGRRGGAATGGGNGGLGGLFGQLFG
jgi:hypothetical protein